MPSYKVASTSPKRNRERLFSLFHCIWRGIVRPGRQRVAMQIERSLDRNGISYSWINRYLVDYCLNIEIYFLQEKKLRDLHYF